jgi:hypothetical protein
MMSPLTAYLAAKHSYTNYPRLIRAKVFTAQTQGWV